MYGKTELMEAVLTSPEAQKIVNYLSPIYGESYVGLWLLQIIGMQLDKMHDWTADMALQVTPKTATWTIEYWEQEYNLLPQDDWDLERRRKNIIGHMQSNAPINKIKLERIATNVAGVRVDIIENVAKNTFRVAVREYTEKFEQTRQLIEEIKPAHLIYTIQIAYEVLAQIYRYAGVGMVLKQKYELEVE